MTTSKNVSIGGQVRPFSFNLVALRKLEGITGLPAFQFFESYEQNPTVDNLGKLLFSGFYGGAKASKQQVDFDIDDVLLWLGDSPEGTIEDLIKSIGESLPKGKATETSEASDAKN